MAISDIQKINNNLLAQQDVETAMTTFNPIGIKKRAEYATKDLEEARA